MNDENESESDNHSMDVSPQEPKVVDAAMSLPTGVDDETIPTDTTDPTIAATTTSTLTTTAETTIAATATATTTTTTTTDDTIAGSSNVLPLDWTQLGVKADDALPLRYPQDVAEWSITDVDLCIIGTAGQKITQIPPDFADRCSSELESLVLRSHMIRKMQGLEGFAKLRLLELYDNQVEALECLDVPGPNLQVLDMSYNSIRDMAPVQICTTLQELYLANNKLKSIAGLGSLKQLKKIDLGANRIRIMDENELSGLINLEELWIGKNKIEKIQGLEKLTKLRRLDVQSNRLTKIENLTTQRETLEELFLAHNGIDDAGASCETGLAMTFTKLNMLDLSRNRLTSTRPLAHLPAIEELWISGNQIATFDDIVSLKESAEAGIQSLDTIYMEYNPVASEFEYRKRLKEWIPSLSQIDATMIVGPGSVPMVGRHPLGGMALTAGMTPEQLQEAVLERARFQALEAKAAEATVETIGR